MFAYVGTTIQKIISFITCLFMVCTPATPVLNQQQFGAANDPTIRQEINIIDSYLYAASGSYATSSAIVQVASTSYSGATAYFEVVASTTAATNATFSLVNATSGEIMKTITMQSSGAYKLATSTSFTMPDDAKEYTVKLGNEAVGKGIRAARIVIRQTGTEITKTETQIEIGSATTSSPNTNTLPLTGPKYWLYTSANWDASPTFYAEVTYKVNPVASSTIFNVSATTTPTFYTYTASNNVGYMVAEAWGGGGGGDGVTSAATIGGGGGGGGTYARSTTTAASGDTVKIGVGRGGAEGTAKAVTASSTVTVSGTTIVTAEGGEGATSATGAATSSLASSVGQVIYAGGSGGNGETTADTGGGGGGSAGPDGYGISGKNAAANGPGGNGGAGNLALGGAGGAGGNGADDTCDTENGGNGINNVLGGGGGGGADGDVSSICLGGNGGRPGGGGGGSDEGANTSHLGGPGQVKITEYIGTVGIALEEDDGAFGTWTFKTMIVNRGQAASSSLRVRTSFTPTDGRNYRIVASTTNSTATYDIYNAKIVAVQQAGTGLLNDSYSESNFGGGGNTIADNTDAVGQAFTAANPTGNLATVKFYMSRTGTQTGNVTARLYALSGTYGTDSIPTGAALATSDNVDVTTITGSNALITFTFSGANKYAMTAGTTYFITVDGNGVTFTSGSLSVANDTSSPTHSGNNATTADGSTWSGSSITDTIFYVYSDFAATTITLIEPQYLLANKTFDSGTSLQDYDTYFDPSDWDDGAGGTTSYYHEASSQSGGTSDIKLQHIGGTPDVTGSTITDISNRERTTAMTMPSAPAILDAIATTNNSDIYSSRIIVQWAYAAGAATPNAPYGVINSAGFINVDGLLNVGK